MFLLNIIKPAVRLSDKLTFTRISHLHNSAHSLSKYSVVSLYHLAKVDNVDRALYGVRKWLHKEGVTGRFHINSQGVNCQLCFNSDDQIDKLR